MSIVGESEEVEIDMGMILRREDGILCVVPKDNYFVTLKDAKESYEVVKTLADGKRALLLSLTGVGGTIHDEARDYWVSRKENNPIIAEAIVAKSLVHRIVVNFAIKFYNAGRAIKMFNAESDAINWLNTFRSKLT